MTADVRLLEERIAALEAKLGAAQEHLDILNLIGSYGPLVDSGAAHDVIGLYAGDGEFHQGVPQGGFLPLDLKALHAVYAGKDARDWSENGCCHVNAVPRIRIDGDSAQASNFSLVLMAREDGFSVTRAAINDWRLRRETGGWVIKDRYNHPVDGSAQSHQLMRRAGEGAPAD